jgi:hypothetical protein
VDKITSAEDREKFQCVLKLFADAIKKTKMPKNWRSLIFDMRGDDSDTRIYKVRAELADSSLVALLDTPLEQPPNEVSQLMYELWVTRANRDPAWYGVKICIARNGSSEIIFDENPNCIDASTFWDV